MVEHSKKSRTSLFNKKDTILLHDNAKTLVLETRQKIKELGLEILMQLSHTIGTNTLRLLIVSA